MAFLEFKKRNLLLTNAIQTTVPLNDLLDNKITIKPHNNCTYCNSFNIDNFNSEFKELFECKNTTSLIDYNRTYNLFTAAAFNHLDVVKKIIKKYNITKEFIINMNDSMCSILEVVCFYSAIDVLKFLVVKFKLTLKNFTKTEHEYIDFNRGRIYKIMKYFGFVDENQNMVIAASPLFWIIRRSSFDVIEYINSKFSITKHNILNEYDPGTNYKYTSLYAIKAESSMSRLNYIVSIYNINENELNDSLIKK